MFSTIVIGLDGSKESTRAADLASELASREGARVVAVHVREVLMGRAGGQPLHADEHDIEREVQAVVDRIAETGVNVTLRTGTSVAGGPAHVIAQAAEEEHADLIVVGTRGHRQVAGLLVGSVTQRLLHIAPAPVLAMPASAVAAETAAADATATVAS